MKILIFSNKTCPKCTVVKENINSYIKEWKLQDTTKIVYYDIDTVDGSPMYLFRCYGNSYCNCNKR